MTSVLSQIEHIKERCVELKPLVAIKCLTYNHEPYLRDALEGFVMQKTDFPFIAIVHDDASTDKTAEILREYAEKYPDIIFPIYETENQYSKRDRSISKIMNLATEASSAKYIALCEGDDYWIDPLKLQKQVSFLEANPEYSLCSTNSTYLYPEGKEEPSQYNTDSDKDLDTNSVILKGGLFLTTASLLYRQDIYKEYDALNLRFHVGDYPLQIFMAHKGKVKNLSDTTTVYRVNRPGSWTSRNFNNPNDYNKIKERVEKEMFLLDKMNEVTGKKYNSTFKKRKNIYCYTSYFLFSPVKEFKYFINSPKIILKNYSLKSIIYSFLPQFYKQRNLT